MTGIARWMQDRDERIAREAEAHVADALADAWYAAGCPPGPLIRDVRLLPVSDVERAIEEAERAA